VPSTSFSPGLPGADDRQRYDLTSAAERRVLLAQALARRCRVLNDTPLALLSVLTSDLPGEVVELTLLTPQATHTRRARPHLAPQPGAVRVHHLDAAALSGESTIDRWYGRLPPLLEGLTVVAWAGRFTRDAIDQSLELQGRAPSGLEIVDLQQWTFETMQALRHQPYRPDLPWTLCPYGVQPPDRTSSRSGAETLAAWLPRLLAADITDPLSEATLTRSLVEQARRSRPSPATSALT